MFKVNLAQSFVKDLQKLPKEVQSELFNKWIPRLQEDPQIGQRMVGKSMRQFWKLPFRYKRNDYRLVYQIVRKKVVIVLLAVGSRENFYEGP